MPEVSAMMGLGPRRIMQLVDAGAFPRPIKIGSRKNAWLRDELSEHLRSLAARREQPSAPVTTETPPDAATGLSCQTPTQRSPA